MKPLRSYPGRIDVMLYKPLFDALVYNNMRCMYEYIDVFITCD